MSLLVTRIMLDYLDPRSLSILYVRSPEFLKHEIRKMLPNMISVFDTDYRENRITIHKGHDRLIANINHIRQEIEVTHLECLHNIQHMVYFYNYLYDSIIEVIGKSYTVRRGSSLIFSTPWIHRMILNPNTRIAIPNNVMKEFKVNYIGGFITFQNKFIIL